ncbi:MAG: acetyl ornithine aminotransferase family protein [bacterium]|nr:acetyl ornithine aminotransferase family protein [Myxococcales bacterium]MCB9553831.1 acetyl ornithine aminotransferase family protein [Myxococcales bacterium]
MSDIMRPEIRVEPPGPKASVIIAKDRAYSSPSYIKEYPLVVDRGEGPWVYDVDGNRYLDLMAGIATTSTGHAHPKVVDAIQQAAAKFLHICGTDFYYQSFSDLCERLAKLVPEMGPKKVFLTNSGSEALDGALKLVRSHTRRRNVIAFRGAFHGRTLAAISLNASKVKYRKDFGPLLSGVYHTEYPPAAIHRKGDDDDGRSYARRIESDIFQRLCAPDEVAAIMIEPILGEGGYVPPPKAFLQELRRMCDEHGIMLVFDEVQSGMGRTGHMFACEHYGVYPDVLLSAKGIASGMPIGAIIAREPVMSWGSGTHGSTYGGNPVCCAAALATIDVIEGLLPQVRDVGEYLMAGLRELAQRFPVIAEVRGVGLMVGAEFLAPNGKPAAEFVGALEQLAFRKGLLLLGCGKSTIRFAPPLVLTREHVDAAMPILADCLAELCTQFGYPMNAA